MRIFLSLFMVLLAFTLSGCDEEPITAAQMKSPEKLYDYYCKSCHEKQGPGARMEKLAGKTPMKPYKVILLIKYGYEARHNMPAFQEFSDEQAATLAQYVVNMQLENNRKLQK